MRVLYDTNVLVGILSRRESILEFKRLIKAGIVTHITSKHILSEAEAVLVDRFGQTKRQAKAATRLLSRQSTVIEPIKIPKICRDPFDDYILAAALMGRAACIITEDKDLLVIKEYKGIRISTVNEFTIT